MWYLNDLKVNIIIIRQWYNLKYGDIIRVCYNSQTLTKSNKFQNQNLNDFVINEVNTDKTRSHLYKVKLKLRQLIWSWKKLGCAFYSETEQTKSKYQTWHFN